jgi:hypothetical protein
MLNSWGNLVGIGSKLEGREEYRVGSHKAVYSNNSLAPRHLSESLGPHPSYLVNSNNLVLVNADTPRPTPLLRTLLVQELGASISGLRIEYYLRTYSPIRHIALANSQ